MRRHALIRTLVFVIILCLFAGSAVYAAPYEAEVTQEVDVSDSVLQEGGLPSGAEDAEVRSTDLMSADTFKASDSVNIDAVFAALSKAASNWNGEESVKVSVKGYGVTPDNVKKVFTSFMNTHGEYFFVSAQFKYGWVESAPDKVTSITFNTLSGATVTKKKAFDKKVDEIVGMIDPSWSDVEKVLFIHDYLVTHCGYDEGAESTYHYDAYSCLIDNSCVCQGYSLAFDYLARLAGVDSYLITSKSLGHAWNMVKTGNNYYHVDCTFDDPMKNNKDLYPGYCRHEFLMLSYSKMRTNKHYSSDWLIDSYDSAAGYGTDTKYDSGYFWTGSIARIIPVSSHKWCYLEQGSKTVKTYNFSGGSIGNFASLPESFSYASMTYDGSGEIFVSTAKKIYRINSTGTCTSMFTYMGSTGSIYGIDVSGPYLIYYIYKNEYTYLSEGKLSIAAHWEKKGGKWYFVDENDQYLTGFNIIDGVMYYFDSTGAMVTGWKSIDGSWYYFETSGAMKTGWFKSGSVWYYFKDTGVMAEGLTLIKGKYYFFKDGGAMKTGWQQSGDAWYYFKSGGEAATGWQKISKVWYYFDGEGRMLTGWQDIEGVRYYFKDSGSMATGWLKYDGNYYYLASGGAMKAGWVKSGSKWYYMDVDGVMVFSCSLELNGKEYRFDASGACVNP